jgi:hypothetical protein
MALIHVILADEVCYSSTELSNTTDILVLHETVAASKKKIERIVYLKFTIVILNSGTIL